MTMRSQIPRPDSWRDEKSMCAALDRILFRCNSFLDDERDMSQDSIAAIAMICTKELKKARGEE
jgi:hypothetical protein